MRAELFEYARHLYLLEMPGRWLDIFTIDLARYLFGAGMVSFVLYRLCRDFSSRHRIQPRKPGWRDIGRELRHSTFTMAVYATVGLGTLALIDSGRTQMYSGVDDFPIRYLPMSVLLLLLLHDAYFYWVHRLMHHPRLFNTFHRVHHMSRTPTPWAAYSFAIPEAALMAGFVPIVILFLPVHSIALFVFLIVMILRNAMGHSGIEFHPTGLVDSPLDALTTVTHHDMHHQKFNGNFGLYFTWWDRWMGTEFPEYKASFRQAATGTESPFDKPRMPEEKLV